MTTGWFLSAIFFLCAVKCCVSKRVPAPCCRDGQSSTRSPGSDTRVSFRPCGSALFLSCLGYFGRTFVCRERCPLVLKVRLHPGSLHSWRLVLAGWCIQLSVLSCKFQLPFIVCDQAGQPWLPLPQTSGYGMANLGYTRSRSRYRRAAKRTSTN